MDFSALIKKSFSIAWHNRVLWLFGFLSGGVGTVGYIDPSGFNYHLPAPNSESTEPGLDGVNKVLSAVDPSSTAISSQTLLLIVLGIVAIVLVLLLIFIFISNWAAAALVFSILQRDRQRPTFSVGAKAGLKYWWKFYLLTLTLGVFILAFIFMLASPALLLFLAGWTPIAIVYIVVAAIVFIIAMFVIAAIGSLIISIAQRMIVHKNTGVLESIRLSGGLIRKYLGESLLTYIVAIGLNFGGGFLLMIAALPLAAILFILFIANLWLAAFIVLIPAAIFLFTAGGFWSAFQAAYWTLFYEHLANKEGW